MGQEQTTTVLPFRIKLKKDCTKNAYVHLYYIAEVAKPSSKMTLWYPKHYDTSYVAGASKITYTLLWQFFNTNKFKKNIYYLLLYSNTLQDNFKIQRTLPRLHKNYETFYRSNSRWLDASFDTEKSWLQVWCYKNSS